MIDILLLNVTFFSFHKSQVVEFSGDLQNANPLECPTQKFGQNVATQSWPIKSCLQSCSKVSGADFESSPGSKDQHQPRSSQWMTSLCIKWQGYSDIQCLFIVIFRSFRGVGTPKNNLCQLTWYIVSQRIIAIKLFLQVPWLVANSISCLSTTLTACIQIQPLAENLEVTMPSAQLPHPLFQNHRWMRMVSSTHLPMKLPCPESTTSTPSPWRKWSSSRKRWHPVPSLEGSTVYHLHAASQHEKMMVQLGECPMLEPIKLIPTSNRHLHKFGVVFCFGIWCHASRVSRSPFKDALLSMYSAQGVCWNNCPVTSSATHFEIRTRPLWCFYAFLGIGAWLASHSFQS